MMNYTNSVIGKFEKNYLNLISDEDKKWFLSDEGPMLETSDWQYTNLFIFRFVSLLCLRRVEILRLFTLILVDALHNRLACS